ncbi:MAG TPA: type VII secretion integral membrane protein EccD, partial [Actinomycetospora sp.]|uniref:type VII secretion integral membrane protein EccD n=1 Tax=Actinomycetospora sp. TaxID=1872135 RepID=UPI002F423C9B
MSTGTGRGHAPAALGRPPSGPAAPATPPGSALAPTPPSPAPESSVPVTRISVLAPTTRIDVALPGDVPVAELLGVLVEMTERAGAGEDPAGHGGAVRSADRPGGAAWTLAPLGAAPVDPRRTLDDLSVLDGDQLVLRRRADAAPAPLYDDVVDAVAESAPASYRPWDEGWAHALGLAGAGVAGAVALGALVAAGRGPGTAGGLVTAGAAALLAVLAAVLGASSPRLFSRPGAAAVLGLVATGAAAVCGLAAVPSESTPEAGPLTQGLGAPHLLLAAALALVAAGSTLLGTARTDRPALAVLVGLATAAGIATVVGAVATVVGALAAARGATVDAPAVAAGAGAVGLVVLSALPRLGIALARLPLPQVPASAAELAEDAGPGDPASLDRRADRAHALLAGLAGGGGAVLAAAAAVLAADPGEGWQGTAGWVLAVLLVALPALRSRSYANALPASVLLVGALVGGAAV